MKTDIKDYCAACYTCGRLKTSTSRAPMIPMKAGFPNEIVGMDIIGPLTTTPQGNRYILVMVVKLYSCAVGYSRVALALAMIALVRMVFYDDDDCEI